MRKPADLAYGLDDRPPAAVVAATALQQATVVLIWVFPTMALARALELAPEQAAAMFSMAFIACGIGTLIQASRDLRRGSGFLAPVSPSSAHLVPSLLAAQAGGLALMAGMTIVSGLATVLVARVLGRIRDLLPPEIAGVVVFIIGIAVSLTGARLLLGAGGLAEPRMMAVAATTLLLAIGLSVWGRGILKWACMLIAMATGTVAAVPLGQLHGADGLDIRALPLVALPDLSGLGYAFDLSLLPLFLVASLASALKTAGVVTNLGRINDADWVRPDQRRIAGGVTGDGLGTIVAGALAAPAVNLSATNVALQMASGVTSRVIAYATAALCVALACVPQAVALLSQVPTPVIAATLIYSGGLMLASGMQLACARLLDARRSLSVGLAVFAAMAVEAVPQFAASVPQGMRPLLTATAFGTLVALTLNVLLRIGVRRTVTLRLPAAAASGAEVEDFVTRAGASWGARRDVIARTAHVAAACLDALSVAGVARGEITLALGFDETRLDIRIGWQGAPLVLSESPPSAEQMLEEEDAPARLAGYMLRRLSDRLRQRSRDGATEITLYLDH